jgi:hypothetical protein
MKVKINKEEKSQVEIEVTIPWADFNKYWDKGFKKGRSKWMGSSSGARPARSERGRSLPLMATKSR